MATLISLPVVTFRYNGRSSHAWKDAELPCAKAVGRWNSLKANHHGVTNTNQVDALKALNPQTIVVNSWVDCHPRTDILNSMETTLLRVTCLSLTSGRAIAPAK